MSKPIMLTDAHREKMIVEFADYIKKAKMSDGSITYTKNFRFENDLKATIDISSLAYVKMMTLIHGFDTEVGWHGVAYRDDRREHGYIITDVLVYPQVVTGGTVDTDEVKYGTWLYKHDDEVFNNIRMQGHSHVNFSTIPSGTDWQNQRDLLAQVEKDMFYIFFIWNKKGEKNNMIYDMRDNIMFESKDIEILVDGTSLDEFLKESKTQVEKKTYTPAATGWSASNTGAGKGASGNTAKPTTPATTPAPVTSAPPKEKQKEKQSYDDYGYGYGYPYGGYNYGSYRK